MIFRTLAAVAAAIVTIAAGSPASAQRLYSADDMNPANPNVEPIPAPANRITASRTSRQQRTRGEAAPALPTPEENLAAAQQIIGSAGVPCQGTEATLLGMTAEQYPSYEIACATGPGYIVVGSTPPQAVDCVLLAGQAETDRLRDPAALAGTQCAIPQNADVLRVVSTYAREAGVPCAIDQGASIGKSPEGNLIYEVGCRGADGYWIERQPTGWSTAECAVISTQNATCRYSTPAEQAATFQSRINGSEAASCAIAESRYMGANSNGAFYEAKCGAGNGVVVRFNPQFAVQQVYPCETAQRIGGGCRLTVVPAATQQ